MKKLYVNIEDIHIKGGPNQLTEVVTRMDNALQKLSQETEDITAWVARYSISNKGSQYEKMAKALADLRNKLYDSSQQLNEIQNEIVLYQEKVMRYEGISGSPTTPNKYIVSRANIHVDTTEVHFILSEMNDLKSRLNSYCEMVYYGIQDIVRGKNEIAQVWLDTQYNDFSEFVDEINMESLKSLSIFREYLEYLDTVLKEVT